MIEFIVMACVTSMCFLYVSRLRDMVEQLIDHYPLDGQKSLPLKTKTFACIIHNITNPRLINFTPAVVMNNILFDTESPDDTFTLPASVTNGLTPLPPTAAFCIFVNEGLFLRRNSYLVNEKQTDLHVGGYVVSARLSGGVNVQDLPEPVVMSFIQDEVRLT